jgi:hypothetical protein
MSEGLIADIHAAERGAASGYRVERRDGCTLIFGSMPMSEFAALANVQGNGAVLSTDLAQLTGATFAWGPSADVDALVAQLRAQALERLPPAEPTDPAAQQRRWLAVGEHGMSSCAIFVKLTGLPHRMLSDERGFPHPLDPDDLRRCLLLLRAVPSLAPRIGEMAACSPQWAALAGAWDELTRLFAAELAPAHWEQPPHGAMAPKTYARMRALLG